MSISPERRAEINRQNAQKSTGPKTEEGKAASRRNALKHGLAAATLEPPDGSYQGRLAYWVDDLRPSNVLEHAMVERACRATWKLDRCARYEEAAEAERRVQSPSRGPREPVSRTEEARQLGALLMLAIDKPLPIEVFGPPPPPGTNPFDDPAGVYRELCSFPEGVSWLLNEWKHMKPGLVGADGEVPLGPAHFLETCRARAVRLLGLQPDATLSQPMREVADAECVRLDALYDELIGGPIARRQADLALLASTPESQHLIRYEAAAERELHRAVDTFLKLRKNPELVAVIEAEEKEKEEEKEEAVGAKTATRRTSPPARNEATASERLDTDRAVAVARTRSRAGEERRG